MSYIHGKHVHSVKTWRNLIWGFVFSANTVSVTDVFEIIDCRVNFISLFFLENTEPRAVNGVNWSLNGKITSDLLKCIFSYIVNGFVAQNDERHFFAIQCKVEITFSPENWATIAGSILRGYANSRLCKHPNVVWLNFAPSCKPHGQKCILLALLKKCILGKLSYKKNDEKRGNWPPGGGGGSTPVH